MARNRLILAEARPPAVLPTSFMLLPLSCLPAQAAWQMALYEWALARAQEAARPSLLERDLLAAWN